MSPVTLDEVTHVKRTLKKNKRNFSSISWTSSITSISDFSSKITHDMMKPPPFLRERQADDYRTIMFELMFYNKPLIITKPTGTGKTALFIAMINAVLKTDIPIIVVVPTISLINQTYQRFVDYSSFLDYSLDDISIFSPSEGKRNLNKIVIMCQQSFIVQTTKAEKNSTDDIPFLDPHKFFHPSTLSFVVLDEGHHAIATKTFDLISNNKKIFTMFSASTLPGEYGKLDLISKHIVTYTLADSILFGELSPIQFLTIDFSMYESARVLAKTIRQYLNYKNSDELTKEAADAISRVYLEQGGFTLTSINVLLQLKNSGKTMIFTNTIEHAEYIAKMVSILLKKDIFAYHSSTENKENVLNDFRSGKTKIIVAVNALDEGFDDSDVNLILDFSVYIIRTRKMIQRIGRSLRKRDDKSSAIYLSVKILPDNLQLLPSNYITGNLYDTHLCVPEDNLINENSICMSLPENIIIDDKLIKPRGAAITFPKQRRQFLLGHIEQEFIEIDNQLFDDFNDIDDDFKDMLKNLF